MKNNGKNENPVKGHHDRKSERYYRVASNDGDRETSTHHFLKDARVEKRRLISMGLVAEITNQNGTRIL